MVDGNRNVIVVKEEKRSTSSLLWINEEYGNLLLLYETGNGVPPQGIPLIQIPYFKAGFIKY